MFANTRGKKKNLGLFCFGVFYKQYFEMLSFRLNNYFQTFVHLVFKLWTMISL